MDGPVRRQQIVSQQTPRKQEKKQDEPRPLGARLAVQKDCRHAESEQSQRPRHLIRRPDGQRRPEQYFRGWRPITELVSLNSQPLTKRPELRLGSVQPQPNSAGNRKQTHGLQNKNRSKRHGHLSSFASATGYTDGHRDASAK